jgi:hypothetical protein
MKEISMVDLQSSESAEAKHARREPSAHGNDPTLPTSLRGVVRRNQVLGLSLVVVAFIAICGHGVIWLGYEFGWGLPIEPITAIVLTVTGVTTFGGFYIGTHRMRVAIAASFILVYFIVFTFALSLGSFSSNLYEGPVAALFTNFLDQVEVVVLFYLGAEAAIGVGKAISTGKGNADPADIRKADRDE